MLLRGTFLRAVTLALSATTFALSAHAAAPLDRTRVFVVTESHDLVLVPAAAPGTILASVKLTGLEADEHILGIDYRIARGVMFAMGSSGRIYTVAVDSGVLTPVGKAPFPYPLEGSRFGFDFNPAADRIRIVSDSGQNLRAHPDTGALVDAAPDEPGLQSDGALAYATGDTNAGRPPRIVAAAYTYNTQDEKLTTNFAIDADAATLVRQGSLEGVQPVVSPNTGQLTTVGKLGVDGIVDAHFDISDVANTALAAIRTAHPSSTTLYRIDLASGRAQALGPIGNGAALRGLAIEP
ncbi:MAG: DUF4394 domain-containing protein [Thauera sp.]|nr:DUF4394 domain-containing protein [Thauera sp.]